MQSALAVLFSFLFWSPQQITSMPAQNVYRAGAEPACDNSRRGAIIVSLGGAGQPDMMKVCLKDGAGHFAWRANGQQNSNSFVQVRTIGGCPIFPDNNIWNTKIDSAFVASSSAAIINTYAAAKVGTAPSMTVNLADAKTPMHSIAFDSTENDGGKYPVTQDMSLEGYDGKSKFTISGGPYNSDAHLIVLRTDECKLYEIFFFKTTAPPYRGGSGAMYDLTSNHMRPDGWTSADAAGLPIWPGVLTYEELYGGQEIRHMVRFTVDRTRNQFVWPARHYASRRPEPALPPMGSRWRLKASFDGQTCRENENSGKAFPPEMQRLVRALKGYGMILADNGLAIKITTDADHRWGNPASETSPNWIINGWTHCITGRDFEVVDAAPLMMDLNSAAAAK